MYQNKATEADNYLYFNVNLLNNEIGRKHKPLINEESEFTFLNQKYFSTLTFVYIYHLY